MFKNILLLMREKVRTRFYVMTVHAQEEMTNDDLSIYDVEHAVLVGEIKDRQRDTETGEWKYIIRGKCLNGMPETVVAKISTTGKLVIITVFIN